VSRVSESVTPFRSFFIRAGGPRVAFHWTPPEQAMVWGVGAKVEQKYGPFLNGIDVHLEVGAVVGDDARGVRFYLGSLAHLRPEDELAEPLVLLAKLSQPIKVEASHVALSLIFQNHGVVGKEDVELEPDIFYMVANEAAAMRELELRRLQKVIRGIS
jgi:hypothetical protein